MKKNKTCKNDNCHLGCVHIECGIKLQAENKQKDERIAELGNVIAEMILYESCQSQNLFPKKLRLRIDKALTKGKE